MHSGNMSLVRAVIPGFILQSEDLNISTDSSWRCKVDDAVKILSAKDWDRSMGPPLLLTNERVDGGKADKEWLAVDFDDSEWDTATRYSMKVHMLPILEPRRLVKRTIPMLPETEEQFSQVSKTDSNSAEQIASWDDLVKRAKPVQVSENSRVTVVLDSALLTTGLLQLHFRGGARSKIRIRCAECFEEAPDADNPNLFARRKGDREDTSGVLLGLDDYYSVDSNSGASDDAQYEPFWFRTFRYVELSITTEEMPLKILKFSYRASHYPLDITTQFSSFPTSEMKNQWEISLNTLRNCMHETYEDCPFYEQNQFAMDGRMQILFTYQLAHDDRLARKCMQEFYSSRRPDGLIETHFPSPFPGVNIPYFSLYWILMVYDHMMYMGDERLVRRYLGAIDGILDHFSQRVDVNNGLVGRLEWDTWPFVDWAPEWSSIAPGGDFRDLAVPPSYRRTGFSTYSSLICSYTLKKAADICDFVKRCDTADEYRRRAADLNNAVLTHCFRGDFIVDGPDSPDAERSQHSHVFAVLSGALEGESARLVLLRALTEQGFVRCSYAMSFYVLEAALQTGIYDRIRTSLLEPWSTMIHQNLTTWAESAAMPRSDCHGWSAVPIHDFVANVAGIRPTAPGFKVIRFEPRRSFWENMSGIFATGTGLVLLSWSPGNPVEFTPNFDVRVEVPQGHGSYESFAVRKSQTLRLDIE
ncbi:uncharacterized protein TRUGW13939_07498 [Talaromyces rugulosus]|uniref:Alpha-L-rhamnosidase six-hairpin glycosidase domain-containing protein n=1 Tax=Talaromyces rugulosus TaxID=121627 RepID=A0A7H8R699_TALRU|nr:uncharacterized protein TRUGW13939_07498 [Talaromyces rugulosus]QKX60353.1 hypothetical protein TRUGW13939_07498 [Talaromyces rugulosus]